MTRPVLGPGFEQVVWQILNSGIDFNDNVRGGFIDFTSSGTPGAESQIVHGLGYTPVGYLVLKQDKAGSLYTGVTAWTNESLYLRSDVASLTATLFVL